VGSGWDGGINYELRMMNFGLRILESLLAVQSQLFLADLGVFLVFG
jgi:hypothetical protein